MRAAILLLLLTVVPSEAGSSQDDPTRPEAKQFFRLADLTLDGEAQVSVLGARKVDPSLFPASFFVKGLKCTSSLVGSRVLLTAAHCVAHGETIALAVPGRVVPATCTQAPGFQSRSNPTADYALCLTAEDITETAFYETVNIDASRLATGVQVLLTGFGCTKPGGGGDTSGQVYRVGEATITSLPAGTENRLVTMGDAALCFGDSGGPAFIQQIKDGGPRIQISVNVLGANNGKVSALASLSTPEARAFLAEWSEMHHVNICGFNSGDAKCRPFP